MSTSFFDEDGGPPTEILDLNFSVDVNLASGVPAYAAKLASKSASTSFFDEDGGPPTEICDLNFRSTEN